MTELQRRIIIHLMIRLSNRSFAILIAGYAFGIALWLTLHHAQPLIDDGFYYFKIAEHLARGDGSTFDGIHFTNGYHPLWAFLLVPIFSILPPDESARSVASLVQGSFFAASAGIFYATARTNLSQRASIAATFVSVLLTFRLSLSATEYSLDTLCITIIAFLYLRWFRGTRPAPGKYLTLGIFLCIAFLGRIETLLLAFSIGIFLSMGTTPKKFFVFALPLVLVSALYAIANLFIFNYPLPVSGAVKHAWSDYYLAQSALFQSQGWLAAKMDTALIPVRALLSLRHLYEMLFPLYLVIGVYGVAILFVTAWIADRTRFYSVYEELKPLAPFILYSLLNSLGYIILFQGALAYTPWYFVIQPWLTAVLFAVLFQALLDWLAPRARRVMVRRVAFVATLVLSVGIVAYTSRLIAFPNGLPTEARPRDPLEKAALWLRDNTPRDAVVGSWNAGIISYYSQRRVVNLDGLVNSWDYFRSGQYDLCRYWAENRISFIADVFDGKSALSPVPSYPYYKKCADQMELVWSDAIEGINSQVRIYRLLLR